jgi:hypothetical protein
MPKTYNTGDAVTCEHETSAYGSNYGGQPKMSFKPGMIGFVASIAPKVNIVQREFREPGQDAKDEFVVVDFFDPETNKTQRCGLDFINIVTLSAATRKNA